MTSTTELLKVRDQRTALLLEAIELLVEEIAVLAARDWEKLPDLKKRKVVAASGLRRLRAETEAADGAPITSIESLIADLEEQSQRNIRARLDLIGNQILVLQEISLYLREALHVTLRHSSNRPLGNDGPLV
jgi:hypothetical protein